MMEPTSPNLPLDLSVSPRDIASWGREKARLEREVADIIAKIDQITQRISAAETLFSLLGESSTLAHSTRARELLPEISQAGAAMAVRSEVPQDSMSIISAVLAVIQSAPPPIAPYQVKEKLAEGEIGERIRASDKGFYNAISRLAQRGQIKKHNGWLFTPEGLHTYLSKVKAGEIVDEKPTVPTRSPMGDMILEFIQGHPGATSGEVISFLKTAPEMDAALNPNTTVAYNIISRLTQRNQIIKRDGKLYPLASEAKEPPTDIGSGSDASEVAPSLSFDPHSILAER